MNTEEKPKMRVGTWAEYYLYKLNLWTETIGGFVLMLLGVPLGIAVGMYAITRLQLGLFLAASIYLSFASILGSIGWVGCKSLFGARKIPPVLPPTLQNTAALPARDVLVRASAEPAEEAEKTLLRATVADSETPVDELLRPR